MPYGVRCGTRLISQCKGTLGLVSRRNLLTLAIESSADDTCVAILEKHKHSSPRAKLHFNERITAKNTGHGGIHPIEALDSHRSNLSKLVGRSLHSLPDARIGSKSTITLHDGTTKTRPDFVSVTRGPGMRSNLSCGLDTAKGLATAWQIPLVGVHHMQAHALTPRLVSAVESAEDSGITPQFPFLTLLISGGHTMLVHSKSLTEHSILATTRDIAIGDALDKAGRIILPQDIVEGAVDTAYGKYLSAFAFPTPDQFHTWPIPKRRGDEVEKPINQFGWQIRTPLVGTRELAFSFSGIESNVNRLMKIRTRDTGKISADERLLFARTAMGVAFEHLASRTIIALEDLRHQRIEISNLVVSGGVAANDFLRFFFRQILDARSFDNVRLIFPPVPLCTDNAAMIAWAGMEMFEAGYSTDSGCDARRKWSMDSQSEDGGILGIQEQNYLLTRLSPHL